MKTSRLNSFSSTSPSFGSFSSAVNLAAIAARVVDEFRDQDPDSDTRLVDDDDFEFAFDCPSHRCSHQVATADEIFSNGQIRPLIPYDGVIRNSPVNVEMESQQSRSPPKKSTLPRPRRPALRKLMSEEDRDPTSNSSSEAEEDLTGVPPETYCVWTPRNSNGGDEDRRRLSSSPSRSKIKSNSAGFSKRWRLRNIIYARSISEGNAQLVFPAPVKKSDETVSVQREEEEERESEETKRQSYAPYRKDMIGILKNVNGLSRHLRSF